MSAPSRGLGLLWEGDPYKAGYWATQPDTAGASHVIPEEDIEPHERSASCLCGPSLEWCSPGWLWTHHSLDGREA